jgi:hypothetical protein
MKQAKRRGKPVPFPVEQGWLRSFVRFHGLNGNTCFCEEDLHGVPLVKVVECLRCGAVISAEKCDGPGTACVVEYYPDDPPGISVCVHFVANEDLLRILRADEVKECNGENPVAA